MALLPRVLLVLAGLIGAAGVAAAAGASHSESRNLSAMAAIFLAHAPALTALALHGRGRALLTVASVLAAGTLAFGGDLALRQWLDRGLFAGAAPLGGGLMILGWLGLSAAGVLNWRRA
jgi:uncharacterized membrane protein YgdD (TMEM256/DUF423 family)